MLSPEFGILFSIEKTPDPFISFFTTPLSLSFSGRVEVAIRSGLQAHVLFEVTAGESEDARFDIGDSAHWFGSGFEISASAF
jgi:hypothetical protein